LISGRILLGATREIILPQIGKTETFIERSRGLLGCRNLEQGHGLLITPCNSIHTFFMKMSIDVVFLSRDNAIVAMKRNMQPRRFAMSLTSAAVLELPTGQIRLSGLKDGDQLVWEQWP